VHNGKVECNAIECTNTMALQYKINF